MNPAVLIALVVLLTIGLIFVYLRYDQNEQKVRAEREAALRAYERAHREGLWNAYQWALQNMAYDPVARSQVVLYGRAWYGYLRGGHCSTFDELAIQNDIKSAGC